MSISRVRRVRFHFPWGVNPVPLVEALCKAVTIGGQTYLLPEDMADAEQDAVALRAELTGLMTRALPGYEDHMRLLAEVLKTAKTTRRHELLEQRKRLYETAKWTLRTHLSRYYTDQFINGKRMAGSARGLQRNEREVLRRLVNNEMEYMINALLDAETGDYIHSLAWRGKLYGNAVNEALWMGYLYADLSSGRYVRWVLNPAEHCLDCLYLAGALDLAEQEIMAQVGRREQPVPTERERHLLAVIAAAKPTQGGRWGTGVYRAQELARLAIFPQAGRLACTTNCKCRLEPAERPQGKPRRREAQEPWQPLIPKSPTMLKRSTRSQERARLAELAEAWSHRHVRRREKPAEPAHLKRPRR